MHYPVYVLTLFYKGTTTPESLPLVSLLEHLQKACGNKLKPLPAQHPCGWLMGCEQDDHQQVLRDLKAAGFGSLLISYENYDPVTNPKYIR